MNRRDFFRRIGRAAVALPFAYSAIAACGGDDGGGGGGNPDAMQASCASPSASIGTNHGHTLTVSAADVTAGTQKDYDIQGSSGHAHSVTLTAADFSQLQGGNDVTKTSTSGAGHTHTVTVTCA